MTDFPATANAFLEDGIDQGELRQRMQDQLLATKQLIGAVGIEDVTIASGSITPTRGTVRMLYQGTAVDDLVSIVTTNLPDGSLLLLSIKDEGYAITVKHGTGAGNTSLTGGIDFVMNKLTQRILLQRMGTLWNEVLRSGRALGLTPTYESGWSAYSGFSVSVDELGDVAFRGAIQGTTIATEPVLMATMGAGNRPASTLYFPVYCLVGGVPESAYVSISAAGEVWWYRYSGSAPSTETIRVYMSSVRFQANG